VSILAQLAVDAARIRRKLRRREGLGETARRLRFIEEHAPGRSFADIGGMFGIDGDIALRAARAGAAPVTLFDAGEPTDTFLERARAQGSDIRVVQGDLEDPVTVAEIGPHQIVWCSGVIYHTPNPVNQLVQLRQITTELLFLGSATIPEIPGFPQACMYYPYLDARDRAPFARAMADPAMCLGLGTPFDDRPMYGHGNFWWGITPSALRAMLRTARFEVVDEIHGEDYPWGLQIIAHPVDEHPSLPPLDYYRRRGERLREGRPPPFDGYYDKGENAVASAQDIHPDMAGVPKPDVRLSLGHRRAD
jgi:hypothetical protein